MAGLTNADRQAGRVAMEGSLTPLERAVRKFGAGKPSTVPRNTPLAAVALAGEQRARLEGLLAKEPGTTNARVTSAAVVIRVVPRDDRPLGVDTILVDSGKEGQAVAFLEMYGERVGCDFEIVGLLFAVLEGDRKYPVAFLIERTPEGKAALEWSIHRQRSGVLKPTSN